VRPQHTQDTSLSIRVSAGMRRVLALSLLACFGVFVATIEIERTTLDPNIVQQTLAKEGNLQTLKKWSFSLFDCPSITINDACKAGPTQEGTFPITWPEAGEFSAKAKGFAIARATLELNDPQKNWMLDKGDVSLVLPRNVALATRTPHSTHPQSVGIGTATEIPLDVRSVVQKGFVEIEFDYSGLPMFGPRELEGAIVSADSVGTYQSLPARQLAANHLVMQLGIGFPLFIAALALVLDHSAAFALLSIFGILRSLRSFIPFWYENSSENLGILEPLFFIANGLCFAAFVLFALELTHIAKVKRKILIPGLTGVALSFVALGYFANEGFLTIDLYGDMAMGLFGTVCAAFGIYKLHKKQKEEGAGGGFSFSSTSGNIVALALFAIAAGLMAYVNAKDLVATFQGEFKTLIDWKHIAIFPAMTAAALFEIGFTSKKVLSVANEMTEKALMDKELQTAQEFQRQTLPPMRFENEIWQWRAIYKSASKLGGDWFDVREITFSDGRKLLAVGLVDVTGHGVGAAMVTTIVAAIWGLWCKDVAQKCAPASEDEQAALLKEACERLQAALSASRKEASGTGAFALVNGETRGMTYCTAGHPAIVLTDSKTLSALTTPNSAFGHGSQEHEREWKIANKALGNGENLIFYSDGIIPAETDASSFIQSFRRRMKKETLSVPTEFFKALRKAKQTYRENRDIEDDVTVLVVEMKS
jgi:serine phosphatase RsbU (regulator of sigma subunit)